jgi:alpha 1,2-mannosyltransferase
MDFLGGAASRSQNHAGLPQSAPLHLNGRHANATLLMLARNSDLEGALSSVRELEARFNHHFNYPWTFLNDVPFDEEFMRRMRALIKAPVTFGVIPREHWVQAEWINETKAAESRQKMADCNIIYGDSLSYRNMCRFNSGVRRVCCDLQFADT